MFLTINYLISLVELFLYLDKQGTPEVGRWIQRPKRCVLTYHYKDEDNSPKNHNQNNIYRSTPVHIYLILYTFILCIFSYLSTLPRHPVCEA